MLFHIFYSDIQITAFSTLHTSSRYIIVTSIHGGIFALGSFTKSTTVNLLIIWYIWYMLLVLPMLLSLDIFSLSLSVFDQYITILIILTWFSKQFAISIIRHGIIFTIMIIGSCVRNDMVIIMVTDITMNTVIILFRERQRKNKGTEGGKRGRRRRTSNGREKEEGKEESEGKEDEEREYVE